MRILLCGLIAASLVSVARGQNVPAPPKGAAPLFGVASAAEKDGKVVIDLDELRDTVRIRVMDHDEFLQMENWLPLMSGELGKDIRAYRPDGKPADAKQVLKALSKPGGVMYFVGHDKAKPIQPDPFYLRLLREGSVALAFDVANQGTEPVP